MNNSLPEILRELDRRGSIEKYIGLHIHRLPALLKAPNDIRELPALNALADKMAPALRRAFLEAVRKLQANIDLEKLAAAIAANQLTAAEAAAKLSTFAEVYGEMAAELRAGFLVGSGLAIRELAQSGIELRFDLVNPHAVEYAQRQVLKIVEPFKQDAKELIREFLQRSLQGEMTPSGAAKDIKDLIGLDPNRVRRADKFWESLIERDVPDDRIQARVGRYMDSLLRERAEVIARNEIHRAAQQGTLAAWKAADAKGLIDQEDWVKVWVVTWDEALCDVCEPMDGVAVGLFEPFTVDTDGRAIDNGFGERVDMADAHVQCRCSINRVLKSELDAYRASLNRPDEKPVSRRS